MLINVQFDGRRVQYQVDSNTSMEFAWVISDILKKNFSDKPLMHDAAYTLRVPGDNGDYLNDSNFRMYFRDGADFVLKLTPEMEVTDVLANLRSTDVPKAVKAAVTLSRSFLDPTFTNEYIRQRGVPELTTLIVREKGGLQRMALIAFQELMAQPHGWENLPREFLQLVVTLMWRPMDGASNIHRPAMVILTRLTNSPKYGFSVVNDLLKAQPEAYPKLVERFHDSDVDTSIMSMALINALFANATGAGLAEFLEKMEQHQARRGIMRLLVRDERTEPRIDAEALAFQRLIYKDYARRRAVQVDLRRPDHNKMYNEILQNTEANSGTALGFNTAMPDAEFAGAGQLGLELLNYFAKRGRDHVVKYMQQMTRQDGRKCALGPAAVEISKALMEHFQGTGADYASDKRPTLLALEELFSLAMQSLFKLWNDMEAREGDLVKVVQLVKTQLEWARKDKDNSIDVYSKALLQASYKDIQKRQLEFMEAGDDLLVKLPVRNLKDKVNQDCAEFVRNQRLACLLQGAWFAVYTAKGKVPHKFRYYRLSPNKKSLHWAEFTEQSTDRPPLENLPEKIDLSTVTELALYSNSGLFAGKKPENVSFATNAFSLMSGSGELASLADFVAENAFQFSEWTDGLRVIIGKAINEDVSNRDTLDYIDQLTQFEMTVRMVDIRMQRLVIPDEAPAVPPPPPNYDFVR